jgi:glutaminyl-tRNA synthetase
VEENLRLFEEMKAGKYKDGEKTLRAKIDMSSPNINMRDPVLYRILHVEHHRQGKKWCIYPMYDFAHPLQDAFEGITHSLCSIEYDNHRPLYDWVIEKCEMSPAPHQYEWGRLNITNTIMSKRYLRQLVEGKYVTGYDDPRMPTLVGLRRKGVTAPAIREFILYTGLSRINSTTDASILDHYLMEDQKLSAKRLMAVIDPLEVVIDNYPEGQTETFQALNNMENPELGSHTITFSKGPEREANFRLLGKPYEEDVELAFDENWILLLQLDTDANDYFDLRFYDMGLLYLMIERDKLHNGDFSNIRVHMTSL